MEKDFSVGEWVVVKMEGNQAYLNDKMRKCENKVGIITKKVDVSLEAMGMMYHIDFNKNEDLNGYFQSWCLESFYKG